MFRYILIAVLLAFNASPAFAQEWVTLKTKTPKLVPRQNVYVDPELDADRYPVKFGDEFGQWLQAQGKRFDAKIYVVVVAAELSKAPGVVFADRVREASAMLKHLIVSWQNEPGFNASHALVVLYARPNDNCFGAYGLFVGQELLWQAGYRPLRDLPEADSKGIPGEIYLRETESWDANPGSLTGPGELEEYTRRMLAKNIEPFAKTREDLANVDRMFWKGLQYIILAILLSILLGVVVSFLRRSPDSASLVKVRVVDELA